MTVDFKSMVGIIDSDDMTVDLQVHGDFGSVPLWKALQDFKSQVSGDKQVVLSSWNNSVHVCNWKGVTCGVRDKRVTRLDLGGLQLGGVISQYIGNLSFLISLDLSNNTFGGTIPHEVGNLLRLDYLDMSYNSLVGAIPISLFNCSRLLELYLNSNPLGGGVPSEWYIRCSSDYRLGCRDDPLKTYIPADGSRCDGLYCSSYPAQGRPKLLLHHLHEHP
ncbi:hypothetical protein F2Q70_00040742 [Brassica cretica]|uniref:Leucine-rich repeat-containing N-terminal plant-type domain-containing protein n=1 Tax=Brassica cretica TaxID=69181 RepID=A0A8S9K6U5_BRACR|nr:hypothetical protein F2Q70_00040742 [Brassica cretica]